MTLPFHVKSIVRNSHSIQLVCLKKEHFGSWKTLKDEWYAINIIEVYHRVETFWELFLYCESVLYMSLHSLYNEKLCNICVPILTGFQQSCNSSFMFVVDFSPQFFDGQFHIIFQSFSAGIEKKFIWIFWKTFLSLKKYFQRMEILFFHNQN